MPHIIRLREPWEREWLAGGVRIKRQFNWLAEPDPTERIWLIIGPAAPMSVTLNGAPLTCGEGQPAQFDITALLRPRNLVAIDLPGSAGGAELGLEIRLEIRA